MADAARARVPRGYLVLLLAAAALGFFSNIWNTPLFDLDEGAFSQATIEMVNSGNYLTTTLNGAPRYDKPILIYWLQAASIKMFGIHAFAFRLPSALCALLWMWAVWSFARRYAGGLRPALIAALTIPLGLMTSVIGHAAIADALLNLFLALTFFDIYRYFDAPRRGLVLRIYLWMGLGLLAKGPVAVVLPLIVSGLFFLWQRRMGDWRRAVFNPIGWAVTVLTVAPWVLPLWQRDHGAFLDHFIIQHNVDRYTTTLQGHGGKLWYYVLWLPLIVMPFTTLLWPALRRGLGIRPDLLDGYLTLWFGVTFVLFSFSGTQLPHYLLYGCSGLFVLFGRHAATAPHRGWCLLPPLLLGATLAALPWILPLIHIPPERAFERGILDLAQQSFTPRYYALAFGNLAVIAVLMFWSGLPGWRALITAGFSLGALVWFGVVPVLAAAQQAPIRAAALTARDMGLPVVSYDTFLPSFSVYRGAVTPEGIPDPGQLVFVRRDRIPALKKALQNAPLVTEYEKGGVALLLRPAPG